MKNIIKFIVKDNENDQRVDLFLSNNKKELSRTRVKNLILNERLLINEKICTDPFPVGQRLSASLLPAPVPQIPTPRMALAARVRRAGRAAEGSARS